MSEKLIPAVFFIVIGAVSGATGAWIVMKNGDATGASNTNLTIEKSFFAGIDTSQPGYWLVEEQKAVLGLSEETEIISLLDIPRGYHERDLSSKPEAVSAKEYYTAELNLLFLQSNGSPVWLSLESQKEDLRTTTLLDKDTDADGLTDFEEKRVYKTELGEADTDTDGFNDFEEISSGYDPIRANGLLNERYAEVLSR